MKGFVCALIIGSTLFATTASADIAATFGNTVVSRYPDGGWVKHWFDRDGAYRAEFSDGRRISATWRIEGEKVCLNGIRPAFMMISRFCSPMIQAPSPGRCCPRLVDGPSASRT